jgi:hypothetical protein
MVSFEENAPWTAAVIRPADWRPASAQEMADDARVRAHNANRPFSEWLMPLGVTDRDGQGMVVAVTHGMGAGDSTLCGLPDVRDFIYRHPFYGTNREDCRLCAARLGAFVGQRAQSRI